MHQLTTTTQPTTMKEKGMVQTVTCLCGEMFAAYMEPDCYTDAEWHKELRKYAKKGYTIKTVPCINITIGRCSCKKQEIDPNQTSLVF